MHADNQAIDTLQKQLTTMILEPTKREQAEKRIRSGDHQIPMQRRANRSKAARPKQSQAAEISDLKTKISELPTLVIAFSKQENKTERVAIYPNVCFTDSSRAKPAQSHTIKSDPESAKQIKISTKTNSGHNEKFIKNMSNKDFTEQETALLAKGLKFIPTSPPLKKLKYSYSLSAFKILVR